MKNFQLLLACAFFASLAFAGCGGAVPSDCENGDDDECALTEAPTDSVDGGEDYMGEWNRVTTYTDGMDMQTGTAVLTFADDGTFVSTTSVCTATGEYTTTPGEKSDSMTMNYVQSNCPGPTVSSMTYLYNVSINDANEEVLTLNASYEGHVIMEIYKR